MAWADDKGLQIKRVLLSNQSKPESTFHVLFLLLPGFPGVYWVYTILNVSAKAIRKLYD